MAADPADIDRVLAWAESQIHTLKPSHHRKIGQDFERLIERDRRAGARFDNRAIAAEIRRTRKGL